MSKVDDLIRDRLSKDGEVLSLKAQFLREVGAKELAENETMKGVRALDLSQNSIGDEGVKAIAKSALFVNLRTCLLYTSPSPRDAKLSRMPSSA